MRLRHVSRENSTLACKLQLRQLQECWGRQVKWDAKDMVWIGGSCYEQRGQGRAPGNRDTRDPSQNAHSHAGYGRPPGEE